MVFPKSNLSTAAQPWGRFVEKSITNLETTVATERVNNAARDAQASLSIKRLDQSVTAVAAATVAAQQAADDAQAAIDGLTSLGSIDSDYTINAGNINAGTLTGVTIQTAASGTRLVLNESEMEAYYNDGSTDIFVGTVSGSTANVFGPSSPYPSVALKGLNGNMVAASDEFTVMKSKNIADNIDFSSYVIVGQDDIFIGGNGTNANVSVEVPLYFMDNVFVNSGNTLTVNGTLSAPTVSSSTSFAGNLSTDGSLTRTALATGASTTCTINGSGQFVRTTSSARYKQDIQPLEVNYDELLSLEPKRFRLKEEAETNPDARFYAGFIAEEIDQTSLKDFVGYSKQEDGSVIPESVYYAEMTAALLAGLKKQDSMIKELQAQVAELQSKVQ